MKADVSTPCPAYNAMAANWVLPDTLWEGTAAMRAAGKTYLPREPAESESAYQARLSKTTLENVYRDVIETLTGKVFDTSIALEEDVPEAIRALMENVDLAGNNLNVFCRNVFLLGLRRGANYILVDMPQVQQGITLEDERKLNARPYWINIEAKNIIGWRHEIVNGVLKLVQLRISEVVSEPDGEFGQKEETQIRVLEPGKFRTYRQNKETKDWVLFSEGVTSLQEITLVEFYTERTGPLTCKPPFLDLAYLNATHWQSSSDQRHILHVARVPLLFAKNLQQDKDGAPLIVGANRLIYGESDSDLKYVEHSGSAIEAGERDLEKLVERMREFGRAALVNRPGNQTATAKAIDTASGNSALKMWALALQDAIEQALVFTAKWMNIAEGGGSVVVNTEFSPALDSTGVDQAIKVRAQGDLSQDTLWKIMQKKQILPDDFDPEKEKQLLEEEGPKLGEMGIDPLTGLPVAQPAGQENEEDADTVTNGATSE